MIPNPYVSLDVDAKIRLNVDVAIDDILTIKGISPGKGITQAMVANYIKAIADELRSRNIRHYSEDNLKHLEDIIRRRTAPFVAGKAHGGDDASRASAVHHVSEGTSHVKRTTRKASTRVKG